jgi:putative phage-type endonuclease
MNDQRTPEWFQQRCGKVTASRVADILAKTKTGYSADRKNYAAQLVAERLTGTPAQTFSNAAMQWGTDTEPMARVAYETATGHFVTEVGFIPHPDLEMAGASPDGLVGDDGLVEIKCPNTATHIDYLLNRKIPSKYEAQMAWQLICTGRKWCDWVSFDPRMPEHLQLLVIQYRPTEEYLQEITKEIVSFLDEVADTVMKLQQLGATK